MILGRRPRASGIAVHVESHPLWSKESTATKLRSVLTRGWQPRKDALEEHAQRILLNDMFGDAEDFGPELYDLQRWHHEQEWNFEMLLPADRARADAIEALSALTRLNIGSANTVPRLNLGFAVRAPLLVRLVYPMVVKVPVRSLRSHLETHPHFVFAAIRSSAHPEADGVISYLYELLFLQQKIAHALNEYLRVGAYAQAQKGPALFINAELQAIMGADLVFAYLKASFEKSVALAGLVFGMRSLDSKRSQKARRDAFHGGLPPGIADTPFGAFFLDYLESENLDELNSFRSGLFHKKGIAELQPHTYVGKEEHTLPRAKIFGILHEQHLRSTAVLLCALALLTDRLVQLVPPAISQAELVTQLLRDGRATALRPPEDPREVS